MASLLRELSQKPVSNVKFNGRKISFDYDGKKLSYVVVRKSTCFVGNWSRSKNEVYYDAHLKDPFEIQTICIHEAVEKYVTEKYGLDVDRQSHRIAQAIEKRWFEKHKRNWASYDRKATRIWKIHGSC